MKPPRREKPPARRQGVTQRMTWHTPDGADLDFHVTVNFARGAFGAASIGGPIEIFLRPTTSSAREGAALHSFADDIGEQLSLLLQVGLSVGDLEKRFKPGGLSRVAAGWIGEIADQQHRVVSL